MRDSLGYFRARSLSNPSYRDGASLLNRVKHGREDAVRQGDRGLVRAYDAAIAAADAWLHQPGDELWFQAVAAVDAVLVYIHDARQEGTWLRSWSARR